MTERKRRKPAGSGHQVRPTRAERSRETWAALHGAAAAIVGEYGYNGASVARITSHAKVAQGSFYTYFRSRQDLFEQLLPAQGDEMLEFIAERVRGSRTYTEHEERGARALFEYLGRNPGFLRLLSETEIAAPDAYRQHFDNIEARYVGALRRAGDAGEVMVANDRSYRVFVEILSGARGFLADRFGDPREGDLLVPERILQTYLKFAFQGATAPASGSAGGHD